MATGYFATRLSENIGETPEGFRICKDVVLARTGWQKYTVRELMAAFPAEKLTELDIDISDPRAVIQLYRPAEEVFAAKTIQTAEGKPFSDGHPAAGLVDPDNFRKYARGHIQQVGKGSAALESGDWPLVGDIIINDAEAIRKVDSGVRQISLGYLYDLARDGDKLLQVGFIINHAALVPEGRAGFEARINDSAPVLDEPGLDADTQRLLAAATGQPDSAPDVIPVPITKVKEKATVKKPTSIFGRLLKALASDAEATPEEVVETSRMLHRAMDEESEEEKKDREKQAEDAKRVADMAAADKRRADDAKAADEKKRADDAKAAADALAKDGECKPGEEGHKDCTADKCMAKDRGAHDADGGSHRNRMHDALDSMLDKHEKQNGPLEGVEADEAELRSILGIPAESKEEDEMPEELEPVGAPAAETMMANDAAAELLPLIEKSSDRKMLQLAFDEAPLDDSFEFLRAIRPAIAKSKDLKVRAAFDAQIRKHTRTSKPDGTGGYAAFGAAARRANDAAIVQGQRAVGTGPRAVDNSKIEEIYRNWRKGSTINPKV